MYFVNGKLHRDNPPLHKAMADKRSDWGCEEQADACVKHCFRNVKSLPSANVKHSLARAWM